MPTFLGGGGGAKAPPEMNLVVDKCTMYQGVRVSSLQAASTSYMYMYYNTSYTAHAETHTYMYRAPRIPFSAFVLERNTILWCWCLIS